MVAARPGTILILSVIRTRPSTPWGSIIMKVHNFAVSLVAVALAATTLLAVPAHAGDIAASNPAPTIVSGDLPASAKQVGATWTLPGSIKMTKSRAGGVLGHVSLTQAVRRWQRLVNDGHSVSINIARGNRVFPVLGVPSIDADGNVTVKARLSRGRVATLPLSSSGPGSISGADCPPPTQQTGAFPAYECEVIR